MKIIIGFGLALMLLQSCNNSPKQKAVEPTKTPENKDTLGFFPVTDYLKGQIKEVYDKQVNPLKYVTIKGRTDSSWLQVEEFPAAFDDFLHPEIDSISLSPFFKESKFMDRSIDAFTFTYEPIGTLPDTMQLQHWDVYVDPETGKVRRVYMVKRYGKGKTKQMTWQGDKWCKIVYITSKPDGTFVVDKEEKITWDF